MQNYSDNLLLDKIIELENYIKKNYTPKNLKIYTFLRDLKSIQSNLSIISLLNYLVDMHREGLSFNEIVKDVNKTRKIFKLVDEYVNFIEYDLNISDLFKEIHQMIILHLEKALSIYEKEFNLSINTNSKKIK